jgi:hypothetical protein
MSKVQDRLNGIRKHEKSDWTVKHKRSIVAKIETKKITPE